MCIKLCLVPPVDVSRGQCCRRLKHAAHDAFTEERRVAFERFGEVTLVTASDTLLIGSVVTQIPKHAELLTKGLREQWRHSERRCLARGRPAGALLSDDVRQASALGEGSEHAGLKHAAVFRATTRCIRHASTLGDRCFAHDPIGGPLLGQHGIADGDPSIEHRHALCCMWHHLSVCAEHAIRVRGREQRLRPTLSGADRTELACAPRAAWQREHNPNTAAVGGEAAEISVHLSPHDVMFLIANDRVNPHVCMSIA